MSQRIDGVAALAPLAPAVHLGASKIIAVSTRAMAPTSVLARTI